jgi:hypothetical protein
MIQSLIILLIIALILYLIWWIVGKFITGTPHQIIGIVLGLILLLYALKMFGVLNI